MALALVLVILYLLVGIWWLALRYWLALCHLGTDEKITRCIAHAVQWPHELYRAQAEAPSDGMVDPLES